MPAADLREAVKALMGQAKDDLAELVAFQSVADPKQFPAVITCEPSSSIRKRSHGPIARASAPIPSPPPFLAWTKS